MHYHILIKKFKNLRILALPNKNDNGKDGWQKSFKKFATKKKLRITTLNELYKIDNLYLFSLEYENILELKNFRSKNYSIFILVYYPNIEVVTQIFIKF